MKTGLLCTFFMFFAFNGHADSGTVAEGNSHHEVAVTASGKTYTIVAEQAGLSDVLYELGNAAGFSLKILEPLGSELKSWNYNAMPLLQLLDNILRDYSTVMLYEKTQTENHGQSHEDETRRLKELWLLARKDADIQSSSVFNVEVELDQPDALHGESSGNSAELSPSGLTNKQRFEIEYIDNLEGLKSDDVIETLKQTLMNDSDPLVRQRAVIGLSDIGGVRVLDALESGLGDSSAIVRSELANSFAGIDHQRSMLAIGQMLMGDQNVDVRQQALRALSQQDNPAARSFIEAALNDKDDSVKQMAREILQ